MDDIFNEDNLDAEKAFRKNVDIDVQHSADIFSEHPDKPDIFRADYTKAMREIAEQENLPTLKMDDKEIVFWREFGDKEDNESRKFIGVDIKSGKEYTVPKQSLLSDKEIQSEDLTEISNYAEYNEAPYNVRFTDEIGYKNQTTQNITNIPEQSLEMTAMPLRAYYGMDTLFWYTASDREDVLIQNMSRKRRDVSIRQQKQNEENQPEQAPDVIEPEQPKQNIEPEQPKQNIEPEQPKQPEPLQAFGMINAGRGTPTILAQDPESGTVYGARQTRSGRVSYTPLSPERVESLRASAEEGDPRVQISPNIRFDEEGRAQQVQAEDNQDIQPPPNIPNIGQANDGQQNEIVRLAPGTKFQYDPETGILSLM